MKNIQKYIVALSMMVLFGACTNDENDIVPGFLDGTQYGVMLDVNVTSAKKVSEADLANYVLSFMVQVKGDKRPIKSIVIKKTFVNGATGQTSSVEQVSLSEFPQTLNLSTANLVQGFPGLSVADLNAGDSFKISFAITYSDGFVVDRFDTSMRTNFTVSISQ